MKGDKTRIRFLVILCVAGLAILGVVVTTTVLPWLAQLQPQTLEVEVPVVVEVTRVVTHTNEVIVSVPVEVTRLITVTKEVPVIQTVEVVVTVVPTGVPKDTVVESEPTPTLESSPTEVSPNDFESDLDNPGFLGWLCFSALVVLVILGLVFSIEKFFELLESR